MKADLSRGVAQAGKPVCRRSTNGNVGAGASGGRRASDGDLAGCPNDWRSTWS